MYECTKLYIEPYSTTEGSERRNHRHQTVVPCLEAVPAMLCVLYYVHVG